ncbi:FAD-linked oxidase C-terminal domain-containing protein [Chloroflexota bacterium]
MINKLNKMDIVKTLTQAIDPKKILGSPRDLIVYSYDATGKRSLPDVIVFPSNTAEVSAIMKIAHREQIPVVVRGAGTNLSGGTVPSRGGIILELSHLNRILDIDTARQRAVVESGVVNLDLQNTLKPLGFTYAPDPASQKISTLGGNFGEDAGGPHCLRYGVTHNHIFGSEIVLADGQVIQVGTSIDDNYGYDLLGILVGSEGTLGIATKLVLRIIHLPESFQTMLAIFESLEDAGQSASDIIAAGIVPGALELMDAPVIKAVEASVHAGYPLDAEAILLFELDVLKDAQEGQVRQIRDICHRNNAKGFKLAQTVAEREMLWSGRRGAFGAVARVRPAYSCQDVTVPRNKLVPMLREVSRIASKYQLLIGNVAHAGDGNLHPLIMFDNTDPEEGDRVEKAGKEILAVGVSLEGTISGEHGIGIEKQDSMPLMFNHIELELMRRVKNVFDPKGILNPGKIIPPEKVTIAEDGNSKAIPAVVSEENTSPYDELAKTLGSDNVLSDPQELGDYQIDGKLPSMVAFSSYIDQICQVVRTANREGTPITPWGNGSKQFLGLPLARTGIVLCMNHMQRLLELDASNLTAEVEAGINHAELERELAKYGLYFPLEPEDAELATIGGSLATDSSGPGRLANGTARDLVLGVTVVTPLGEVIHAGVKTRKNVAGYDLRKLFLGSWGTLGVIAKAILKLSYLPEDHKTLLLRFYHIEDVSQVVRHISNSFLRPQSMDLIDAKAAQSLGSVAGFKPQEDELLLLLRTAGSEEEVRRHITEFQTLAEISNAKAISMLEGTKEEEAWANQRRIKLHLAPGVLRGKAVVPIHKIGDMYQEITRIAARDRLQVGITGHVGSGILYPNFFLEYNDWDNEVPRAIADVGQSAEKLGGFFLVESGPPQIREAYDIISQRSDYELMKRLKRILDPNIIFNPGKVVRSL